METSSQNCDDKNTGQNNSIGWKYFAICIIKKSS